jgi:hypothetical protein
VNATAAGIACACVLLTSACGLPFAGPPSATDILARPARADLKDAHVTMSGRPGAGIASVDVRGDGDIVFKPRLAFHLTITTAIGTANASDEVLAVGGGTYQRSGEGMWSRGPAAIPPSAFSAWSAASRPRYVGEETMNTTRCWHVAATAGSNPLDLWVRESDGFPIRSRIGQLVLDYSRFNRGLSIAAPPAGAIRPESRNLGPRVGEVAHLNGVDVTVVTADLHYQPVRAPKPKPGSRFVVAQVEYVLTGPDPVSCGPAQWRLTDARGMGYQPVSTDREPRLGASDLTAPGQRAGGIVAYEVPNTAAGLLLKGAVGDDTVTVSLG